MKNILSASWKVKGSRLIMVLALPFCKEWLQE